MNDENFIKLIENFINICDNTSSDLSRHRDKLNSILNELNSIDFKYMHTSNIKRVRRITFLEEKKKSSKKQIMNFYFLSRLLKIF